MDIDVINSIFEFVGALFVWMNVYHLYKDKQIKGIYYPTMVFFFVWGLWNLFYYPSLGQIWSFYAGIVMVTGNLVWVLQVMYYKKLGYA